jgi:hypothetical protein
MHGAKRTDRWTKAPVLWLAIVSVPIAVMFAALLLWALSSASPLASDDQRQLQLPGSPVVVTKTTAYTIRPLRRDEVRGQLLPVELPADATNIQFASYSEWVAYLHVVRFEAPAETCRAYAQAVLEAHNRANPQHRVRASLWTAGTPEPSETGEAPDAIGMRGDWCAGAPVAAPWFRPQDVARGLEGGGNPKVWVDLDRGVFYFWQSD